MGFIYINKPVSWFLKYQGQQQHQGLTIENYTQLFGSIRLLKRILKKLVMQQEHSANKNRPIKRSKEVQRMWIKQLRNFVKHIHTLVIISEVLFIYQLSSHHTAKCTAKNDSWKCHKKFILLTLTIILEMNFNKIGHWILLWQGSELMNFKK